MKEFKRILFPVDLSESSIKMVPYVQTVAEKFESKIHLLFAARVFLNISPVFLVIMGTHVRKGMDKIFQPKSIAVVGASERKGSVSAAFMRNLIEREFAGEFHPINPNHKKVWKFSAWPSIRDLEAPVDLAVIKSQAGLCRQVGNHSRWPGIRWAFSR